MEKGQLTPPATGPLIARGSGVRDSRQSSANIDDDVWQGYGVRWTNTGLEITAVTSHESSWGWWIGGAVGLVVCALLVVSLPDPNRGETMASLQAWLIGMLAGAFATLVVALPFYMLPAQWRRKTVLETLEIRPDGITLNRGKYFRRDWVHRIGVDRAEEAMADYPWAFIGIIGTRRIELLTGFDNPTAEVVGSAIEQAKRQLWQEGR